MINSLLNLFVMEILCFVTQLMFIRYICSHNLIEERLRVHIIAF